MGCLHHKSDNDVLSLRCHCCSVKPNWEFSDVLLIMLNAALNQVWKSACCNDIMYAVGTVVSFMYTNLYTVFGWNQPLRTLQ